MKSGLKTSNRKSKKLKPLKASYRELLKSYLETYSYVEENFLLSSIVRKKYQISRTKKTKEASVLLNLKKGAKNGEFRYLIEGTTRYWRLGDGTPVESSNNARSEVDELHKEAWASLQRIQKLTADTVQFILYESCGSNWKSQVPWSIQKLLTKHTIKSSSNPWLNNGKGDILGEANLSQLGTIIAVNWSIFKKKFLNKHIIVGKLDELGDFRNSLAHGKKLEVPQLQYIILSCKLLEPVVKLK